MASPWKAIGGLTTVVAILGSSGCSGQWGCSDTYAERGSADVRVEVEGTQAKPGVSAEILAWELTPHPQMPEDGDQVHFIVRFIEDNEYSPDIGLDACAVDADRVALDCATVSSSEVWPETDRVLSGDAWLRPVNPEQVAEVLLVPNNMAESGRTCEMDRKDDGGTHPPRHVAAGDQL